MKKKIVQEHIPIMKIALNTARSGLMRFCEKTVRVQYTYHIKVVNNECMIYCSAFEQCVYVINYSKALLNVWGSIELTTRCALSSRQNIFIESICILCLMKSFYCFYDVIWKRLDVSVAQHSPFIIQGFISI